MSRRRACVVLLACFIAVLALAPSSTTGYDALDPTGNITIVWDVTSFTGDGYIAWVKMYNYQYFRRIMPPGWAVSWDWTHGEYLWDVQGAEATQQGDCSKTTFPGGKTPHCCLKRPTLVDLLPPLEGEPPFKNCCKNGYLGSMSQDPGTSLAAFMVTAGNATNVIYSFVPPSNFSLGIDGFTCTEAMKTNATTYTGVNGATSKRQTQALVTYKVVCTYSKQSVQKTPSCCVSLSSFYNTTIVPCSSCACACGNFTEESILCLPSGNPPYLTTDSGNGMSLENTPGSLECSPDGCPIAVHYHIKENYQGYWRSKITVTNRNVLANFTNWNLVMEHPNVANMTDVFSFEATTVQPYGVNNTAVFWGMDQYNTILMPANAGGNVQSELLFAKTPEFTLSQGWAFPRKIVFNGEECVMPDQYPTLPSPAGRLHAMTGALLALVCTVLALMCLL